MYTLKPATTRAKAPGCDNTPTSGLQPGEVYEPMHEHKPALDKRDVPHEKTDQWIVDSIVPQRLRSWSHWITVSVCVLLLTGVLSLVGWSVFVWFTGVLVSAAGLMLDVLHRRTTYDTWRPHTLFWSTMAIMMVLTVGLASVITIPGYLFELLMNS